MHHPVHQPLPEGTHRRSRRRLRRGSQALDGGFRRDGKAQGDHPDDHRRGREADGRTAPEGRGQRQFQRVGGPVSPVPSEAEDPGDRCGRQRIGTDGGRALEREDGPARPRSPEICRRQGRLCRGCPRRRPGHHRRAAVRNGGHPRESARDVPLPTCAVEGDESGGDHAGGGEVPQLFPLHDAP